MTRPSSEGDAATSQGERAAAPWRDAGFARSWAEGDSFRDLLDFPRRVAAAIVAGDTPEPAIIIDVAAGPGAVLEIFLEQFPSARGIWTDASEAMLGLAKERLAPFGDRLKFGVSPDGPKHHHNYPLTSLSDHLDAFAAAGITDVEVPWRAFYTCLFMGRAAE